MVLKALDQGTLEERRNRQNLILIEVYKMHRRLSTVSLRELFMLDAIIRVQRVIHAKWYMVFHFK